MHNFPVKGIQIRDAAPIVDQSSLNTTATDIQVVIKRPDGLGDASPGAVVDVSSSSTSSIKVKWGDNSGEKEGRYEWIVDLAAGTEVKLEAEYEVRAPTDFTWQLEE